MANTKGHICPTCGGSLRIDEDRQMYVCPFCGVTFDYEYFREDDVIGKAERALEMREFDSAAQAFDFMLTKEPKNRRALRGKLLVAARAGSIADFQKAPFFEKMEYNKPLKTADEVLAECEPEDKEYFGKFKEMFEKGSEYKKLTKETKEDLVKEREDIELRLEAKDRKIVSLMPEIKGDGGIPIPYDPMTGVKVVILIMLVVTIPLFVAGLSINQSGQSGVLIVSILLNLVCICMLCYLFYKNVGVEEARREYANLELERKEVDTKIDNHKKQVHDMWIEIFHIRRLISEMEADKKEAEG